MTEVWKTASEWKASSIDGLPSTERAIQMRATREGWTRRKRSGRGGGWEYPLSALPKPAQEAYARRQLAVSKPRQDVAVPDTRKAADLKDYQRQTMIARAVVLAEIDRMVLEGMAQNRAIEALIQASRDGTLSPDLASAVTNANARRGNSARTLTRATVYNWIKARKQGAVALAPIPATAVQPIPVWADEFMRRFAVPQKPSILSVIEDMAGCAAVPSYDQAKRFLQRLDAITRNKGRMGPRALKSMRAYTARDTADLWPGAVYAADGHCFDAEVAHPRHGRPFRPEVTAVIDIYTRKIVGWAVGLSEVALDVASAAIMAFRTHTICDIWYCDNGPGFNNALWDDSLQGIVARLSITKSNALPYNSQARGLIERVHQSALVRAAKRLPTYMGHAMDGEAAQSVFKITRADIKAVGSSKILMPWVDFRAFLADDIAAYNTRPHSSLPKTRDTETGRMRHMSPQEMWNQAVADGWTADVLSDDDALDLARPTERRRTKRGLVELWGNEYFALPLEAYSGEDVLVSFDPVDPAQVWVRTLDGRFITTAKWNGHKTSYYPVPFVEKAREKRAKGQIKRLHCKIKVALEELSPAALLEHKQSNIIDLTAEQIAVGEAKIAEILAASAPVVAIPTITADGRPRFSDDLTWIKWLLAHPDQVTPSDRSNVHSVLTPSLRMQLEMAGVSAPAITELLFPKAKAV